MFDDHGAHAGMIAAQPIAKQSEIGDAVSSRNIHAGIYGAIRIFTLV